MDTMDETIGNNPGSEHDMFALQIQDLKAQLLDFKLKNEWPRRNSSSSGKRTARPERVPLFVAVVVDVLDKGEVYLRQQGNNQEYVTLRPMRNCTAPSNRAQRLPSITRSPSSRSSGTSSTP